MDEWVRVAAAAEVPPGSCAEVSVGGTPVALYNAGGTFYATSNVCIHRGGPLGYSRSHDSSPRNFRPLQDL